jgi:ribosomal protein S18 acetylase RimI-like enzyme
MKKLKDEGYNSKEISEFLNINGIKPLRTDNPYTPKLVWVTLKKYQKRLDRIGNNPAKDIASRNSDKNGKFLIGQIDEVLTASIMIDYDGHRGSINYLAVDPDFSGAGYGKILIVEDGQFLLSIGCPNINFLRQN